MKQRVRTTILEVLAVVAAGIAIGLTANATTDTGISLSANHFRAVGPKAPPLDRRPDADAVANADAAAVTDDEGFRFLEHEAVVTMQQSEAYFEERYVFVDARDDTAYEDGHIPGAFHLDHYRAERYLDAVLPACRNAEKVVVYCNGGDCEDSRLAAATLVERGIEPIKLFVYEGGVKAWTADGLPLELGARLSDEVFYPPSAGE